MCDRSSPHMCQIINGQSKLTRQHPAGEFVTFPAGARGRGPCTLGAMGVTNYPWKPAERLKRNFHDGTDPADYVLSEKQLVSRRHGTPPADARIHGVLHDHTAQRKALRSAVPCVARAQLRPRMLRQPSLYPAHLRHSSAHSDGHMAADRSAICLNATRQKALDDASRR
jgi:hypothetical protein